MPVPPYYQNSALYPWIDLLERVALRFEREESPPQKLRKLEGSWCSMACPWRRSYHCLPLSSPAAAGGVCPPDGLARAAEAADSPRLAHNLLRIAAQQPVLFVMEDLHWVDPSTLEFLTLLVDQGPTARIRRASDLSARLHPPWTGRSISPRSRSIGYPDDRPWRSATMSPTARRSPEVVDIVAKTWSAAVCGRADQNAAGVRPPPGARRRLRTHGAPAPAGDSHTLHDSSMARLDRWRP